MYFNTFKLNFQVYVDWAYYVNGVYYLDRVYYDGVYFNGLLWTPTSMAYYKKQSYFFDELVQFFQ